MMFNNLIKQLINIMQEKKLDKIPLTYRFDASKLDKTKLVQTHLQEPP